MIAHIKNTSSKKLKLCPKLSDPTRTMMKNMKKPMSNILNAM
jgi:hypothetical protein